MTQRWLCLPCTMKRDRGDLGGDWEHWVDDHSPPCDCCGLPSKPDSIQNDRPCSACGNGGGCIVWRYRFDPNAHVPTEAP